MHTDILGIAPPDPDYRIGYGSDLFQFGDLRIPHSSGPHPTLIVVHGGFWRAKFGLEYLGHLCSALTKSGFATWNLEYRRLGNPGGGWRGTFDDVIHGTEHLAMISGKYSLDLDNVIAVGHSAGGQLALHLAEHVNRRNKIRVRSAISLAGINDLRQAYEFRLSNGIVQEILGGRPDEVPERYEYCSPIERVPLRIPQRLIHGTLDDAVPYEMSERYCSRARIVGDDVQLIPLENAGHFEIVDPRTKEFHRLLGAVTDFAMPLAEFDLTRRSEEVSGLYLVSAIDASLIELLRKNPKYLHELSSRKFEELVAELFRLSKKKNVITPVIEFDELDDVLTNAFAFYSALFTLYDRCRRSFGGFKNAFIPYDVHYKGLLELMFDEEDRLIGYRVYWPNNHYSEYHRTKEGCNGLNISFDPDGSINFFVGLYASKRGAFSPLVEESAEPIYPCRPGTDLRPHWPDPLKPYRLPDIISKNPNQTEVSL